MAQDIRIRIFVSSDGRVDIDIQAPTEAECQKKCCEEFNGYEDDSDSETGFEEDDDEGFLYDNLD